MKKLLSAFFALALLAVTAQPSDAITRGGELDEDAHPYVALMVAIDENGEALWRCSGTFISSTVYVTAGHCTEAPAVSAQIFFASDVQAGIDNGTISYPYGGDAVGETMLYDEYLPGAFWYADLGAVVLTEGSYDGPVASLPTEGLVDTLDKGRKGAEVTVVGYGLQNAKAAQFQGDRTRYQADVFIVNSKGVAGIGTVPGTNSILLSGDAKHGGTCFGDSGGPALIGDTLIAVTSFGLNANCAGVGGSYRIDAAPTLEWIAGL